MMGRALVNRNDVLRIASADGKFLILVVRHPEMEHCSLTKQYHIDLGTDFEKNAIIIEEYVDKIVEEAELYFNNITNESNGICKRSNEAGGTEETDLNSPDNGSTEDSK